MSDQRVWISEALRDTTLIRPFTSDVSENRTKEFLHAHSLARVGNALSQAMVARALYAKEPQPIGRLPEFFEGCGYSIVSKRFADVLRGFDLGDCKLYDVDVFEHDRTTRCAGDYELLSIAGAKGAFLPEQSTGLRRMYRDEQDIWHLIKIEDGSVAVTDSATRGADIWTEGERLPLHFFISDRLKRALDDAKLNARLSLSTCRVIYRH
ncbi:imm11 family protein [Ovoidimarina sediminis]|uniref:imm11 family protein n=1 Tax=Ovoidimarina sediminis TaxID=3079856 RepID=UPI002931557F|nr:DUF1629 domain-containing protein [Rhodophyticola sp. MJ-SS7]